jgi:hypothetical protein
MRNELELVSRRVFLHERGGTSSRWVTASRMRWIWLVAIVVACGGTDVDASGREDASTPDSGNEEPVDAAMTDSWSPPVESVLEVAKRRLVGRFDTSSQPATDPRFRAVTLSACPVSAPTLGVEVLYVEQALAETPGEPYRQRLYVLETSDTGEVTSRVFQARVAGSASRLTGLCALPERVVDGGLFEERTGCAVVMRTEGDALVGGTVGTGCASTLEGATYATSEVRLTDTRITSWDRGYDASGGQVWGAVAGPYEFDRRE